MHALSPAPPSSPPLPTPEPREPLRLARKDDLDRLLTLERLCFEPERRDTRSTIRRSLINPRHEVWALDGPEDRLDAALFVRRRPKDLRIYSIATHPELRGRGWGRRLLEFAEVRARIFDLRRLTLDVDSSMPELVAWYERHGFHRTRLQCAFYGPGRDAWHCEREIDSACAS